MPWRGLWSRSPIRPCACRMSSAGFRTESRERMSIFSRMTSKNTIYLRKSGSILRSIRVFHAGRTWHAIVRIKACVMAVKRAGGIVFVASSDNALNAFMASISGFNELFQRLNERTCLARHCSSTLLSVVTVLYFPAPRSKQKYCRPFRTRVSGPSRVLNPIDERRVAIRRSPAPPNFGRAAARTVCATEP